ncbi:hypothetical protein ACFVY1_43640 [Streptomyces sp. NPDC058293]|uniref:hypothetical protein n=1 Tax=Streptomyces sp. NPDC058293 TaxID=3346429 RepID=UPI0036E72455
MGRRDAEPLEGEQQMVGEDSPQPPGELSVAGKVSEGASGVLEDGRPARGQGEGAVVGVTAGGVVASQNPQDDVIPSQIRDVCGQ